jgi:hypothetical protein
MGLLKYSSPIQGVDPATLDTIERLRKQIADLETKLSEGSELTKAQTARLEALESRLKELTNPQSSAPSIQSSEEDNRMFPWSLR